MPAVPIYLSGLDSELTLTEIASIDSATAPDDRLDPKGIARLTVDVSSISRVFRFGTNAADLTDLADEDIHFFVDAGKFRDMLCTNDNNAYAVNGVTGTYTGTLSDYITAAYVESTDHGAIDFANDPTGTPYSVNNKTMMKDLFRDLAHQLFNTQYGVDLFQNETDLSDNVHDLTSALLDSNGSIYECLEAANEANRSNVAGAAITDASNVGNVILKAILADAPERLQDLSTNYFSEDSIVTSVGVNSPGAGDNSNNTEMRVYRMPFEGGDSICFHINYTYASTQASDIGIPAVTLNSRLYKIILDIQDSDIVA
jgi:hypothetical protein